MGARRRSASPAAAPDLAGDDAGTGPARTGSEPERTTGRSTGTGAGTTARRLLWFGALWLAGVGTVSIVAWLVRLVIAP